MRHPAQLLGLAAAGAVLVTAPISPFLLILLGGALTMWVSITAALVVSGWIASGHLGINFLPSLAAIVALYIAAIAMLLGADGHAVATHNSPTNHNTATLR